MNTENILESINDFIMISQATLTDFFQGFGPENGEWSATLVTIIAGTLTFLGWVYTEWSNKKEVKRNRIAEELQVYVEFRKQYKAEWKAITKVNKGILFTDYKDQEKVKSFFKSEEAYEEYKADLFDLFLTFSDVVLAYRHKKNTYWTEWETIFHHAFSKRFIRTAYEKHKDQFTRYRPKSKRMFVDYIDKLIKAIDEESKKRKAVSKVKNKVMVNSKNTPPPLPREIRKVKI